MAHPIGVNPPLSHYTTALRLAAEVDLPAAGLEPVEEPILLVENNQDDILLILRAFQRAGGGESGLRLSVHPCRHSITVRLPRTLMPLDTEQTNQQCKG